MSRLFRVMESAKFSFTLLTMTSVQENPSVGYDSTGDLSGLSAKLQELMGRFGI